MDKLTKAVFRRIDGRPSLILTFEKIGEIDVPDDFKAHFLTADLIPAVGYSGNDLPEQSYTYPSGETIRLKGMIKNAEAAKVALEFARALNDRIELDDGAVLYQAK